MRAWGYPRGEWEPEHLEILGPTGSGKSYFLKTIITERARVRGSHVVVLVTKAADKTIDSLGWPVVDHWPPKKRWGEKRSMEQVVYWAKCPTLGKEGMDKQRAAVEHLLESLWHEDANVILVWDEIAYVELDLGLKTHVSRYYREARSLGITNVAATQRGQGVSRWIHSESVWTVGFTPKDEDDAERMAQIFGNKLYYKEVLLSLDRTKREFLLVHNLTNERYISHIPKGPELRSKKSPRDSPRPMHTT